MHKPGTSSHNQWIVDSGQWTVNSRHGTVDSRQLTLGAVHILHNQSWGGGGVWQMIAN
jgi:hypothetical protein